MNAIKDFFLTIVNIGIRPDMERIKKRQVRLVNGVSLLSIMMTLPFTVIYAFSNDEGYFINGVVSIIALSIFTGNIVLNYRKEYSVAKFLLIQCTSFAVFVGCLVTSNELLLSLFFVTTMTQSWLLYSVKKEKGLLFFHHTVLLIYFVLVQRYFFLFDFIEPYRPVLSQEYIVELNFLILLTFVVLVNAVLWFLTWEYEENDEELKNALETSQILLKEKEEANINKELVNKELKRSLNQLEQLAYASSHDLKMPLRGIVSFSQLLKRRYGKELDQDGNEYLDYIIKEGKRQFEQIEGLLNYLKADQKEKIIELVDPNAIIAEIFSSLKSTMLDKNIIIEKEELPTIKCDVSDFEQIIYNLISNAFKFTHPDRQPIINIRCQEFDDFYKFSVEDNGVGFEMQYHDQMFGIFKTLSSEDRQKGSGIGLSICQKIIRLYNGKIWAEAEPDKGAIFYFTFPKV